MKIKLTLVTVFCLLLFACPSSDDDAPTPIEITATNYLFEAEVTQEFYAKTLADLEQNDPNNTAGILEADANLNSYNEFLNNLIETVGIGVLPPPPPCPDSIVGELCFPNEGFLLMPAGVNVSFRILSENSEELAVVSGQPQTLPNSNGALSYYTYSFEAGINGPILLEITRVDENATLIYAIPAGIRP